MPLKFEVTATSPRLQLSPSLAAGDDRRGGQTADQRPEQGGAEGDQDAVAERSGIEGIGDNQIVGERERAEPLHAQTVPDQHDDRDDLQQDAEDQERQQRQRQRPEPPRWLRSTNLDSRLRQIDWLDVDALADLTCQSLNLRPRAARYCPRTYGPHSSAICWKAMNPWFQSLIVRTLAYASSGGRFAATSSGISISGRIGVA